MPPVVLGEEPVRYYELAEADAAAAPVPPDPRLTVLSDSTSAPLLPRAPAGHDDDANHVVVRMVLEDIAVTGSMDEVIRLDALAAIDAIPVAYRAELGRDIRSWLGEVGTARKHQQVWRFRSHFWAERPYVLFGATTRLNKAVQRLFGEYVSLRHQQQAELLPERLDTITIGVLLTPRHDGSRPWDTTVAGTRGDQGIDPKYRAALEMLWGPLGTSGGEPDWDGVLSAFREAGAL